ncbi:MAG: restriction endonuclease subunit S [Mariprofundus sp.]
MTGIKLKPGWKMVKFGEVVKNANLVERDPVASGIERIVGLEHIEPENLHIRRWNSAEESTSFTRKFVPGQTLFGKRRAYQRKVAYAEFEGICSGDILTFEPKDKKILLPELLPFICQSDAFFDHALGTSAGSLSPRTSWKALQDFEFLLPPLDEQKSIAEILWAADTLLEKRQVCRERTQELRRSCLSEMLAGGIGHSTINQFKLRQVPLGWRKVSISEISTVIRGASPRPKGDPRYYGGNVPRVMVADITRDKKYITPLIDYLTDMGAEKSRPVPKGTLVVVCSGTDKAVGLPGILSINACIHDGIIGLIDIDKSCRTEWLFYVFNYFQSFMNAAATHGGTFVNLTTDIVKGIEFALPPMDVQDEFIRTMNTFEKNLDNQETQISFDRGVLSSLSKWWFIDHCHGESSHV